MSLSTLSSAVMPFNEQGQYTGSIDVQINHHAKEHAYYIKASSERVVIESFHGSHFEKLQSLFGQVVELRDELQGMKKVFQNPENMKLYGAGQPFSDDEIPKRIEVNAKRFVTDDPFGRFKVIDKVSQEIIGFAALGHGYVAGESQAALIIDKSKLSQGYGKETAVLIGALALAYFQNQFQVGSADDKKPVINFTATARDSNEISKQFFAKLGLIKIRDLTEKERLSNEPSSLYGLDGNKVEDQLSQMMDISKLNIHVYEF